eukprot:GGOE01036291.1.p2 GENE.GGOE01036291.1~~GGOE01036291.1.p2  ORF type:complete len:189 (+),score=64.71 GGOE01036291.1:59-625(+)
MADTNGTDKDKEADSKPEGEEDGEVEVKKPSRLRHPIKALKRFFRRRAKGKGKAELDIKLKPQEGDQKAPKALLEKVTVEGDGLEGGFVDEPITFLVTFPDGADRPHLKADGAGPSEPELEVEYLEDIVFSVTMVVKKVGKYKLSLFWGSYDCPVPGSPFKFEVKEREVVTNHFLEETTPEEEEEAPS